ncbi:type II toxin-antitoxin system VapB family antitoxin [Blastococcus mobilis]|uniref:Antitoxin VapB n=1 Tax=Blastococcus mobilis TaxID=1938746 RepID=A0A238WGI1_9ACTN|nr:type II toxin-antitoxin system VapB family antitoxin [Blastococcus mobilis]SNR45706.1 antitoxin VapB [Blastococcus mobilis]
MALSIESEEADALARALTAATNESLTQAVTTALRERLARVQQHGDILAGLDRLAGEYTALPLVDDRSAEEIIGYDDRGLPA